MKDPTTYRLPGSDNEHCYTPVTDGRCKECFQHPQRCAVPDTRLQAITDAWNRMDALGQARVVSHAIDLVNAIEDNDEPH